MRFAKIIFSWFCTTVFAVFAFGQKVEDRSENLFKQLGGAGEEIYSLRLPSPSTTGLRSKAAMIPIREGQQNIEIPVESAGNFRVMILSGNYENIDLRAVLPNGEALNPRSETGIVERESSIYGFEGEQFPAEVFTFKTISPGRMRFEINAPRDGLKGNSTIGYLVASSDSPYRLYSYINTFETVKNRPISFVSSLLDSETKTASALRGAILQAEIEIHMPSGRIFRTVMFDDGNHSDGFAGDGIFGGSFVPRESGKHIAQIISRGTTPTGEEFIRTAEHLFDVAERGADFSGNAFARQIDDVRWQINLPVSGLRRGQRVIAHAEIWGFDEQGREQAVAWIGGMTLTERGFGLRQVILPVTLDVRWLVRSESKGGYELRNVRIQDADFSVVLGEAERIRLPEIKISESLKTNYFGEITDEMRMGKRPEKIVSDAAGGKLMLVHGYCSGGNPFPTSHFTNYIVFSDPNKNRTHDQFANLIRNFGAAYPSFGIVAHSQGGAASLHLYTYYWSGLDYASGGTRLIQSVGTPYQGTALAGNLALLGQIFGAGCGPNSNLTYSGAASWLAGIPSWARAKIFYHTTSFEDVWWRYDYCNIATDPFLSDPDDGVVERAYAQLTGGNNLGHKTGWCHTSGMRDPSQTTDAARNANMNANAMR
jgi:hypothetical protein